MDIPAFDRYEREQFSPETMAVLVQFAAADPNRVIRAGTVNWGEVLKGLGRHGLIGLAYRYLTTASDTGIFPDEFRDSVKKAYGLTALRMAMIHRNAFQLIGQLNDAGFDYLIVKGPAIAFNVYPDPSQRVFNDLDIVIHERDWQKMHAFLEGLGFEQQDDLPEPPPKLHRKMVIYETQYFNAKTGLKVEVHYDDILNAGLASVDLEGFWQRAAVMEVRGARFRVLALEDQLVHLCAHAHYHSYTRLNWFSDIALMVRDHAQRLDWNKVLAVTHTEDIGVAVYYTLLFMQKLIGVEAPAEVLAQLKPSERLARVHEHYMPSAKVLSMQPMHRPDFSFYFVPLFQRLLPTLRVMGRRRENLQVMLRLLAPPRDWLKFYYNLTDERWLPLHYVIHPPRLLGVYLLESLVVFFHWITGRDYEYINKTRPRKPKPVEAKIGEGL